MDESTKRDGSLVRGYSKVSALADCTGSTKTGLGRGLVSHSLALAALVCMEPRTCTSTCSKHNRSTARVR